MRVLTALIAGVVLDAAMARAADILSKDVVSLALKRAECSASREQASEISQHDLGRGLKLVEVRCWTAAYQSGSILFAVDPKAPDKARLLGFQSWNGRGFVPAYTLTSPDFSDRLMTVTSRHKGRGAGDCGTIGEWKWTGDDFKLVGYWSKPECDGARFSEYDDKWRIFPVRRQ